MYQTHFGFQHAVPEGPITQEWHGVVAEQAKLLEHILLQLHETVSDVRQSADSPNQQAASLQFVFEEASRILAARAQNHANLETQIATIRGYFSSPAAIPPGAAKRLHIMEQVNATLHANLSMARQQIERMIREES